MRQRLTRSNLAWGAGIIVLFLLLAGVASGTSSGELIDKGKVGQRHWYVGASAEAGRRSVCLEVSVYMHKTTGGATSGQCSAPAARRGIVIGIARPRRGRPAMTAIGGAFAPAVNRVEEVRLDGTRHQIRLRSAKSHSTLSRYRYIGFAVRGPWCVDHLLTYNRDGHLLWDASFGELASIPSELFYEPERVCPSN